MYIKQAVIEGFKTYRERTVIDFEPGINIIVGPNGAGKTNLLTALQFVLSSEYHSLPAKKMQELINSHTQRQPIPRVFVEITLDNEDKSLPEGSEEVKVSRELVCGKDTFLLNGRTINKDQLKSTLHTAGFSKVNSYHVIKQGNVTNMALASDAERLKMLKDAAGYNFWEQLKVRAKRNLDEAKSSLQCVRENINERKELVDKLEKEHAECLQWEKLNNKKKAMAACVSAIEHIQATEVTRQCEEKLLAKDRHVSSVQMKLELLKERKIEKEKEIDLLIDDLRASQNKLGNLNEVVKSLAKEQSTLKHAIEDRERKKQLPREEASLREQLLDVGREISNKEIELEVSIQELQQALHEESQLHLTLTHLEQTQLELISLSAQTEKFVDQSERDAWIDKHKTTLKEKQEEIESMLSKLRSNIEEEKASLDEIKEKLRDLETRKTREYDELKQYKSYEDKLRGKLDLLQLDQSEMVRNESKDNESRQDAARKREIAQKIFAKDVSRYVVNSIDNVSRAVANMAKEDPSSDVFKQAARYRGLLIDQFSFKKDAALAIEAVAGNTLFHHVADDYTVVNAIIDRMDSDNLPRDSQFFALDHLQRKTIGVKIPDDTMLMMNAIHVPKEEMKVAVEQVFGKWLLCRNIDVAYATAANLGIDCVTLQGQRVFASGAIQGGYYDNSRLRATLYRDLEQARCVEAAAKKKHECTREKLGEIRASINGVLSELQKTRAAMDHVLSSSVRQEIQDKRREGVELSHTIHDQEEQERNLKLSLDSIRAKIESLEYQLHQAFAPKLPGTDAAAIESVEEQIAEARRKLNGHEERRRQSELAANRIKFELSENLYKRRTELENSLSDLLNDENYNLYAMVDDNAESAGGRDAFLDEMRKKLEELVSEQDRKDAEIEETQRTIASHKESESRLKEELEHIKSLCREKKRRLETVETELQEKRKEYEKFRHHELAIAEKVKEYELEKDEELFNKYSSSSIPELEARLMKINGKLKRFGKVNRRAVIDYTSKKEKLDRLNRKLPKLTEDVEKAEEMLDAVEAERNESVQFSLQQIAENFSTVFGSIVPWPGRGKLRWIRDDDSEPSDEDESDDSDDNVSVPDVQRLRGIGLDISFTGMARVPNVSCLSGGQRSVISLALVFGMLLMDRAPFYLLDEADMALDIAYRSKTAETLDRFAQKSQFIVTTFWPEMLPFAKTITKVSYNAISSKSTCDKISQRQAEDFMDSAARSTQGSM